MLSQTVPGKKVSDVMGDAAIENAPVQGWLMMDGTWFSAGNPRSNVEVVIVPASGYIVRVDACNGGVLCSGKNEGKAGGVAGPHVESPSEGDMKDVRVEELE